MTARATDHCSIQILYTLRYTASCNVYKLLILIINWRRERDSNPRYAINVYTLSRRALSTTQTPLRIATPNQAAGMGRRRYRNYMLDSTGTALTGTTGFMPALSI